MARASVRGPALCDPADFTRVARQPQPLVLEVGDLLVDVPDAFLALDECQVVARVRVVERLPGLCAFSPSVASLRSVDASAFFIAYSSARERVGLTRRRARRRRPVGLAVRRPALSDRRPAGSTRRSRFRRRSPRLPFVDQPQILVDAAGQVTDLAADQRELVVGDAFHQVPIVRDEQQGARPRIEQALHQREHVGVQVVVRLVEDQHVRPVEQDEHQLQPAPLSSREGPDVRREVCVLEAEALEQLRRRQFLALDLVARVVARQDLTDPEVGELV